LDFNSVVLPLLRSDGLASWVEVELLCCGILSPSSEVHVVGTMSHNNSLHWKSRFEVEWSVGVETKTWDYSLGLDLLSLIFVDDLPFLVSTTISLVNSNILMFNIFVSINIKNSVVLDV
jgi:hypothetical protein